VEGRLRLPVLAAVVFCAFTILAFSGDLASSQSGSSCPYANGLPTPLGCGRNSNRDSIPPNTGGVQATPNDCASVHIQSIASLYSYDDASCHMAVSVLPQIGSHTLRFAQDAADVLPANYKRTTQEADFQATLYCDTDTNKLILAFRGSVSLTQLASPEGIYDWYYTNFLQHLWDRPLQYQAAEDTAELIQRHLSDFDGACGPGRPELILTGHSKGGGQAQDAAVKTNLEAVVFNSDMVNPVLFSDWMLEPPALIAPIVRLVRSYLGGYACFVGGQQDDVREFVDYFATGKISDVRMVNDPLTRLLLVVCRNNLPHAPIKWLENTLTCSGVGHSIQAMVAGHSIETVVRELNACVPPSHNVRSPSPRRRH
jgi:hypothetical protein